ncbi:MAG: 30S ribosomal protein S8e [Candidatus Helarchaeota archaeon]
MVNYQGRSKRKATGGRYRDLKKKRKYEMGSPPIETLIGPKKVKTVKTKGRTKKRKVLQVEAVNLTDFKGKTKGKVKILSVLKNSANKEYDRRKIITKGTIVETEMGPAKITSRPGQHGQLNAVQVREV